MGFAKGNPLIVGLTNRLMGLRRKKKAKRDKRLCFHPKNCERLKDGYCARCHSEMYP